MDLGLKSPRGNLGRRPLLGQSIDPNRPRCPERVRVFEGLHAEIFKFKASSSDQTREAPALRNAEEVAPSFLADFLSRLLSCDVKTAVRRVYTELFDRLFNKMQPSRRHDVNWFVVDSEQIFNKH